MISGISRALDDGEKEFGISYRLIMCFLRHLSEDEAIETLELAKPFLANIHGVGLDSSELNNPPEKFREVFSQAQKMGLKLVAHAGEEGPAGYIWSALDNLNVERIDHGIRALDDSELVARLIETKMPLTVCPLSNVKLRVFDNMSQHTILMMLDLGLCVCVNSDDPSYFGGYITENFNALVDPLLLSKEEAIRLVENSISASFAADDRKFEMIKLLNDYRDS